jgi:hypothetical protein
VAAVGGTFTAGHVYCATSGAAGSGKTITFTISKNGGASIGTCSISGTSQVSSSGILTSTAFAPGDYVTIALTQSGSTNNVTGSVSVGP